MERTPPRLDKVHWDEPAPQPRQVTVFHSNERPAMTPVFGTSVPPEAKPDAQATAFVLRCFFSHASGDFVVDSPGAVLYSLN